MALRPHGEVALSTRNYGVSSVCYVQMIEEYRSIEELVAETQLSERQVRLALAYRDSYPDEVAEAIAENRRPEEEWRELYPFVRFGP